MKSGYRKIQVNGAVKFAGKYYQLPVGLSPKPCVGERLLFHVNGDTIWCSFNASRLTLKEDVCRNLISNIGRRFSELLAKKLVQPDPRTRLLEPAEYPANLGVVI
jgi:hypothetical protein